MVSLRRADGMGARKGMPSRPWSRTRSSNDPLQGACAEIYTSWEAALRAQLTDRQDADDLAVTILALIEGALLLARAHRSRRPLDRVARQIGALLA